MERKEFIELFGRGAVGALLLGCAGGCLSSCGGKEDDPAPGTPPAIDPIPTNVDFTVDLTSAAAANLHNPALGYIYGGPNNRIIVAKTAAGGYVALGATCTHEGGTVAYVPSSEEFVCPNHGSTYSSSGGVVVGPATRALTRLSTTVTGSQLRVQS